MHMDSIKRCYKSFSITNMVLSNFLLLTIKIRTKYCVLHQKIIIFATKCLRCQYLTGLITEK